MFDKGFLIIGGDRRLNSTACELKKRGERVFVYANSYIEKENGEKVSDLKDAINKIKNIIFGIPFSKDGTTILAPSEDEPLYTEEILEYIRPSHVIMGGMMKDFSISAIERGASVYDYGLREDFSIYNAIPTAEAILEILIRELPVTIDKCTFFVIGYGKIGKALSKMLKCLGADVTVSARKSADFALASAQGLKCVKTDPKMFFERDFRVIINTVPAVILTEESFGDIKRGTFVLDVSSYPGFIDKSLGEKYGVRVEGGFSLPAKTAPDTAGKIIADVIKNIFNETKGV